MISLGQRRAIVDSWRLVAPIEDTAADLFYKRLFELKPEYRNLFPGDMARQKKKLISMLSFVVKSLDYGDGAWKDDIPVDEDLFLVILALGRRHSELYGVTADMYKPVAEALLWTLDYGLGDAFTEEVKQSWTRVYTLLAAAMQMGRSAVDPPMAPQQHA